MCGIVESAFGKDICKEFLCAFYVYDSSTFTHKQRKLQTSNVVIISFFTTFQLHWTQTNSFWMYIYVNKFDALVSWRCLSMIKSTGIFITFEWNGRAVGWDRVQTQWFRDRRNVEVWGQGWNKARSKEQMISIYEQIYRFNTYQTFKFLIKALIFL